MRKNIAIHKAVPNVGALDFSHLLDAPAGKHGFVAAHNGHLYFEDGIRVRFIGFNLPARSNTPDHETAEKMAARFASLGVNVIRMHAADAPIGDEPCSWSSCKEAPLIDYERGSSRELNSEGLDRFDYFFAKLKERGIYIHLDLIVARDWRSGDGLDYPGEPGSCLKCFTMINRRMIELQKEYAEKLLCHKNPYTGLRLIDDPAVMTVQINNEDSAIKGTSELAGVDAVKPYRAELRAKWNEFLREKYSDRENLSRAWQGDLHDNENPANDTVAIVEGSFVQPVTGEERRRYADYMEFGIEQNRAFYQEMKSYLLELGVKVPINTSNLIGGAADAYGHSDADVMENNSYFNHPLLPVYDNTYIVGGLSEYVSMNPLTMQIGYGAARTSLLSLGATSAIADKPFVLSEWNEYGVHPFHSTAFVHTVAYACLNDWDGLILYCHHTSENADDQPADEIQNVFDFYNDPSLICQFGFMAEVFLRGLIASASHRVDVVFSNEDRKVLPNFGAMPNTVLPYLTKLRQAFVDDRYCGDADVAISSGYARPADLSAASHSVRYSWDAEHRAQPSVGEEIDGGVRLDGRSLEFEDIEKIAGSGDYRRFAAALDKALKRWRILPEGTGYVDGKLVSETGEICFDPENSRFAISSAGCAYFSGAPSECIELGDMVSVYSKNDRISLALLMRARGEYLLCALGESGMDKTLTAPVEFIPGIPFTSSAFHGKLYVDTFEGRIVVRAHAASLYALGVTGEVIAEIAGERTAAGVVFAIDGDMPAVNFLLKTEE